MGKNKFIAKKMSFQGKDGYMVSQLIDGISVCEQWIPASGYENFCETIGKIPEILEQDN